MTTLADIEGDITLEITGSVVTPERFQRALAAFFDILAEVSKTVASEAGERAEWRVQVKQGSNLIGITPAPGVSPAVAARVFEAMLGGIERLEREPSEPQAFSERALIGARQLSTTVGVVAEDDTRIRVWGQKEVIPTSRQIAEHVGEVLREAYADDGSVEGELKTVSEACGYRVVIYEPIFGRAIRCEVPADLMPLALTLFGRRVTARGSIRYRRDGTIARVAVEALIPFPPDDDLPTHEEVRGILRDLV